MKHRAIVPDASVAVQWFLDEPGSEAALRLRCEPSVRFHVPDLWYLELASATWKRARRDARFTPEGMALVQEAILYAPVHVRPSSELMRRALTIALEAGTSVYDSAYAATTELTQATLVTADGALHRRLQEWQPAFPVELLD